jgi:hypothetical protein
MPQHRSSCRGRFIHFLRLELEALYRQRSAIDAEIKALQSTAGPPHLEKPSPENNLDFRPKPCNLTNCRSA